MRMVMKMGLNIISCDLVQKFGGYDFIIIIMVIVIVIRVIQIYHWHVVGLLSLLAKALNLPMAPLKD